MDTKFKVPATWHGEPDILITVKSSGSSPELHTHTRWLCDITDGVKTYENYWVDTPHGDPRKVANVLSTFMASFADMGGTNEDGEPLPEALYLLAWSHSDAWGMASADEDPDYDGAHFILPVE